MDLSVRLSNHSQRNLHSIFVLDSCRVRMNVAKGGTRPSTRLRSASGEELNNTAYTYDRCSNGLCCYGLWSYG